MITIRPAKIEDTEAVSELLMELLCIHRGFGKLYAVKKNAKKIAQGWLKKAPRRRIQKLLVAERDGKVIGYLWARIKKRPIIFINTTIGEISDLYVHADHRNIGVAKKLIEAILDWFKEKKIGFVEAFVATDNTAAEKAWKSFKFKEYSKKMYRSL